MSSSDKPKVLAVDVLSEIESKVQSEMARIRENEMKQQKVLSPQQAETLHDVYFAAIGTAVLESYADKGIPIHGRSYIRTLLGISELALDIRADEIDRGVDFQMPQFSDARLSDRMSEAAGTCMSVRSSGQSEEDFRFGIRQSAPRVPLGKPDYKTLGERILRGYSAEGRSVENVIRTIPRKYVMKDQSYVLDVTRTMQEAGLHSFSAGYGSIEGALIQERDDPQAQDALRQKYAQIEMQSIDEKQEKDDE
jgi:hypothetical protein